jgi:hypothetical protein
MIFLDYSPTLDTKGISFYGTSKIYLTIFITKMIFQFGPFFELENSCPLEISNKFLNWKGTAHPEPFFELKNDFPQINNTLVLPPNLGVFFFLIRKSSS